MDDEEWRDAYHWSPVYLSAFFLVLLPPSAWVSVGCRGLTLERSQKERKMGSAVAMETCGSNFPLALSLHL